MSFDRFSTDLLKRRGVSRTVTTTSGIFASQSAASNDTTNAAEAAAVILSNTSGVPGAVNPTLFYTVKSFFNKTGSSDETASTLSLLLIDSAKILNVSPMALLDELQYRDDLLLSLESYAAINFYRPPSEKQNILQQNTNTKSFRKRNIVA